MAKPTTTTTDTPRIDPNSGFDPETRIFHSLRPRVPLPPASEPLSLSSYALSLLLSQSPSATSLSTTSFLIDDSSGRHVSYSLFLRQVRSLSSSLSLLALSKGETAFILSPNSPQIPVVFFALLSLGLVLAPANPLGSEPEIAHQVSITRPAIAFATSASSKKLPVGLRTILIDSPEFLSMTNDNAAADHRNDAVFSPPEKIRQSDVAAVLFSSGTTGRVKGVALTHGNLIAMIAGFHALRGEAMAAAAAAEEEPHPVSLFLLPMFHVFGFFMLVRAAALGETVVLMERFELEAMLRAVERHRVTYMPASPPLVVALSKTELTQKYDLSSLTLIGSGGAPLSAEVAESFRAKLPHVEITQVSQLL